MEQFENLGSDLTPFEAEQEELAEFAEWFDMYSSVDRFMESM